MFVFIAAMFGLVFSNNLNWLYFFWEITTLCSFLLIGYSGTGEAIKNSFLALNLNLLGSVAFASAIIWLVAQPGGTLELDKLIMTGGIVALIPAVLISFAGLTKSAQMPFSSWLLGAMVAPTPVSALLHSSTMVKAGVYVIIRFAPVLQNTTPGYMIALVGGFTFLFASAIAISKSNAKIVLAYSTIANLGLIVACAGIGTYEAIWAAILLIIFHAVSKCLLFLGTGTIEHRIGEQGYRGYARTYRPDAEGIRYDADRYGRDVSCPIRDAYLEVGSNQGIYRCPGPILSLLRYLHSAVH